MPSRQLQYRWPSLMFLPVLPMMFILVDLAFWHTPSSADATELAIPTDIATELARRATEPGVNQAFDFRVLYEGHLLPNMFKVAMAMFSSHENLQLVAYIAIGLHVLEALYALWVCVKCNASVTLTIRYVVLVFTGGVTQTMPMLRAVDDYTKGLEADFKAKQQ